MYSNFNSNLSDVPILSAVRACIMQTKKCYTIEDMYSGFLLYGGKSNTGMSLCTYDRLATSLGAPFLIP